MAFPVKLAHPVSIVLWTSLATTAFWWTISGRSESRGTGRQLQEADASAFVQQQSAEQPIEKSAAAEGRDIQRNNVNEPNGANSTGAANRDDDLLLKDFRPRPMLRGQQTELTQAAYPVVDVHTHFGFRLRGDRDQLDQYVEAMNRHNIAICISLDAVLGEFTDHANFVWDRYPNRFGVFARVDWVGDGRQEDPATWDCHRPDFGRRVREQIRQAHEQGCSGLKFLKQFGLGYRNPDGSLIQIDDPRWDPIWETCGELSMPVLIHTADPAAFFEPTDRYNERWEELSRHPDWSFHGDEFPSRESLLAARNRVIGRHPKTRFICAHMANNPEDLATVAGWLDRYPNMYVEFASRIGELGRQPYTAREFLIEYRDRVLFGTDGPWPELRWTYYWRFMETLDEYFPYSEKEFPPQGFWRIYGVGLPRRVQADIYYRNALQLLPGLQEKYQKARVEMRQARDASR